MDMKHVLRFTAIFSMPYDHFGWRKILIKSAIGCWLASIRRIEATASSYRVYIDFAIKRNPNFRIKSKLSTQLYLFRSLFCLFVLAADIYRVPRHLTMNAFRNVWHGMWAEKSSKTDISTAPRFVIAHNFLFDSFHSSIRNKLFI